jgi:hypothetical protein
VGQTQQAARRGEVEAILGTSDFESLAQSPGPATEVAFAKDTLAMPPCLSHDIDSLEGLRRPQEDS